MDEKQPTRVHAFGVYTLWPRPRALVYMPLTSRMKQTISYSSQVHLLVIVTAIAAKRNRFALSEISSLEGLACVTEIVLIENVVSGGASAHAQLNLSKRW